MLKKRVIFTLLYDDGYFMLSRNFRLQKVGDLSWLQKNYDFSSIAFSIDELIILDVSRNNRDESKFCACVKALTKGCFVPISAGGAIRSVEEARKLLHSGADKIIVNTLIHSEPEIVEEMVSEFGSQCVIASIDVKKVGDIYEVWIENGTVRLAVLAVEWLQKLIKFPVGEIYLNSMDRDGTGQGYFMELLDLLPNNVTKPIILAGGAGKYNHFSEGLRDDRVDAVATAHLFNFVGDGLKTARQSLIGEGFSLPHWDVELLDNLKGSVKNLC
ncbi:MAG: imidazole glycerol phosphate synthase cyclase subunit [Gammaproteobacteria bacterium]|nr:imidazole glycerol phosphate synthase cyclase subunit [Gammaproteobacteria bacterium]